MKPKTEKVSEWEDWRQALYRDCVDRLQRLYKLSEREAVVKAFEKYKPEKRLLIHSTPEVF